MRCLEDVEDGASESAGGRLGAREQSQDNFSGALLLVDPMSYE